MHVQDKNEEEAWTISFDNSGPISKRLAHINKRVAKMQCDVVALITTGFKVGTPVFGNKKTKHITPIVA